MNDADLEELRQAAAALEDWARRADLTRPPLGEAPGVPAGQAPVLRADSPPALSAHKEEQDNNLRADSADTRPELSAPEPPPSLRPPLMPELAAAEAPPPGAGLRLPLPVAEAERPSLGRPGEAMQSPEAAPPVLGLPSAPEGRPPLGNAPATADFDPPDAPPALGLPVDPFGSESGKDALQEALEDLTEAVDKLRESWERAGKTADKPGGASGVATVERREVTRPDPPRSGGSAPSVKGGWWS